MHSASCGSGSHTPFLVQAVVLVPFSVIPGGQERFAMDPSIGRPLCITPGVLILSAADRNNNPQLAVHVCIIIIYNNNILIKKTIWFILIVYAIAWLLIE